MTDLERITQSVEKRAEKICQVNDQVWEYAELAFHEFRSADTICQVLEEEGFTVERGLAGIPTCFTGTYVHGSGKPVMGILGEFDALSSLSQQAATTTPQPVVPGGAGHGCGHCSLGAGSLAAVLAIKDYLEQTGEDGTIIYFGCPAEEGAGSKQFMARAGLFDHVDFIYTWHPSNQNAVEWVQSNAIIGANFHFKGRTSHAGAAPHMGRSALDAVELMSVGCNYLREHVIPEVRIHYAYIDAGGTSPNVVQDNATVRYEIRAPFSSQQEKLTPEEISAEALLARLSGLKMSLSKALMESVSGMAGLCSKEVCAQIGVEPSSQLDELFERVKDVARGAALMTGTKMDCELAMAFTEYVPNRALAQVADECLHEVGAPKWDEADYLEEVLWHPLSTQVEPFDSSRLLLESGSTDVGDVGFATPTMNLNVACACICNVGHTWQMTAQACSSIAHKGLLTAGKVLALAAIRTKHRPEVIAAAKAEVLERNGGKYHCPLPDSVQPPLDTY